jgi:hypothetical protein
MNNLAKEGRRTVFKSKIGMITQNSLCTGALVRAEQHLCLRYERHTQAMKLAARSVPIAECSQIAELPRETELRLVR